VTPQPANANDTNATRTGARHFIEL